MIVFKPCSLHREKRKSIIFITRCHCVITSQWTIFFIVMIYCTLVCRFLRCTTLAPVIRASKWFCLYQQCMGRQSEDILTFLLPLWYWCLPEAVLAWGSVFFRLSKQFSGKFHFIIYSSLCDKVVLFASCSKQLCYIFLSFNIQPAMHIFHSRHSDTYTN